MADIEYAERQQLQRRFASRPTLGENLDRMRDLSDKIKELKQERLALSYHCRRWFEEKDNDPKIVMSPTARAICYEVKKESHGIAWTTKPVHTDEEQY